MPVQEETTSATSSGPTSSLTIGRGSAAATPPRLLRGAPRVGGRGLGQFALQRRDLAVHQPGGVAEVAVALGPLGLAAQVVEPLLQLPDL